MKKVITVFLISLLIYSKSIKVKAEENLNVTTPQIIVEGDYSNLDMSYEGYKLISSTLNTKVPGKYYSVYENYYTKEEVIKEIFVVKKEDILRDKYSVENLTNRMKIDDEVLEYEKIDNNKYLLVTSKPVEEDKVNVELTVIEDGKKKWSKEIVSKCLCEIVDLKIIDNKVIVIGNRYFKYSGMDIMIYILDLETNSSNIKFYGGTSKENIKNITKHNDCYYVVGSTLSEKGEIKGSGIDEDIFLLKLDMKLNIIESSCLSKEGNNIPMSVVIVQDKLYIIEQHIDNISHKLNLIECNLDLDLIREKTIDDGYSHKIHSFNKINNTLTIIRENDKLQTNNRELKIEVIDDDFNVTDLYKDIYSHDKYIIDSYNNDTFISLLSKDGSNYNINTININSGESLCNYNLNSLKGKTKLIESISPKKTAFHKSFFLSNCK